MFSDNGAQFFDDLLRAGGWLRAEVQQGLSELVITGLISSDNYAGLRTLVQTRSKASSGSRSRGKRNQNTAMDNAGRWPLVQQQSNEEPWESVEYIARVLLKRYGVVFHRLLYLENSLPSWRELHYMYRRMEARGEIRGGRFIEGMAGEQFALPEAVGLLRKMESQYDQALVSISASDPLNLTGTVIPGERVPAVRKNRILFKDGKAIATLIAGEIKWLEFLDQ